MQTHTHKDTHSHTHANTHAHSLTHANTQSCTRKASFLMRMIERVKRSFIYLGDPVDKKFNSSQKLV